MRFLRNLLSLLAAVLFISCKSDPAPPPTPSQAGQPTAPVAPAQATAVAPAQAKDTNKEELQSINLAKTEAWTTDSQKRLVTTSELPLPRRAYVEIRVSPTFEYDAVAKIAWFTASHARQGRDTRGPLMPALLRGGRLLVVPFVDFNDCYSFVNAFQEAGPLLVGALGTGLRSESFDSPVQAAVSGLDAQASDALKQRLTKVAGQLRLQIYFEPTSRSAVPLPCGSPMKPKEVQMNGIVGRAIGYRIVDDRGELAPWASFDT